MNKYKLIALDLDGTLNNSERIITTKTKDALIKVQQHGVTLVLASGRPAPGLTRESEVLNLEKYNGVLLSYNGGKASYAKTKDIIFEKAIPNTIAKNLLKHLEQFPVNPIVDNGNFIFTNNPGGFNTQHESTMNHLPVRIVDNICDAIDFSPVKILIASPAEVLRPIACQIMEPFKELSFIFSAPFYLEATMKDVNKASTLDMICKKLYILPEETLAFGDAENDILMLNFSGLGVAMGNACQTLKDSANEITLSNDEDGIAYTLSKYFDYVQF